MTKLIKYVAAKYRRWRCPHELGRWRRVGRLKIAECVACQSRWVEVQRNLVPLAPHVDIDELVKDLEANPLRLLGRPCRVPRRMVS